jgi:sugar/nucleoside kinase (ribokinase family)
VALADGMYVTGATAFAIQAAAISVTRPGAQSAAPTKEEILSFIEQDRSEKRI